MKNISKQFAELAIKYRDDEFLRARIKLTLFYTVALVIILAILSVAVYSSFSKGIQDNYNAEDSTVKSDQIEALVIDNSLDNLQKVLVVSDLAVIILIVLLGYYLSGRTLKPIESLLNKQRKFVADSAHELRTPLTVMKTGLQAVKGSPAKISEYEELTDEMLEELDYMTRMVNDLLFLAHTERTVNHEFQELDLGPIVAKQVKSMQSYAKDHNVELKSDIENKFCVNGNEGQIKHLVTNLIKNAIDYNRPNGKVEVTLKRRNHYIALTVKDTGIGITKEKTGLIFDRFYKVDPSRSKLSGGAGLGLSIVKETAKMHGASIDIESEIGKGTIISIIFLSC